MRFTSRPGLLRVACHLRRGGGRGWRWLALPAKRHGQERLDNAITQRLRGFDIALNKGVLDDMTIRARRWPGIFVSQN